MLILFAFIIFLAASFGECFVTIEREENANYTGTVMGIKKGGRLFGFCGLRSSFSEH